jgi:hypothetical protein
MYDFLDTSTPNSGLGTPLRSGGEIINSNFRKLHFWVSSRANIATSFIPTLASGGPTYLMATEYNTGSPMPLTMYGRIGSAPADTANPGYALSSDGQWWKQVTIGGLFPEQFGGKADWNGTTGTDNWQSIKWAQDFDNTTIGFNTFSREIRLDFGKYRVLQTIEVNKVSRFVGKSTSKEVLGDGASTQFSFPNNVTGFLVQSRLTSGESNPSGGAESTGAGTLFEGFSVHFSGGTPDLTKSAFKIRGRVEMNRIGIYGAPGRGIWIRAGASNGGGNANGCLIRSIFIHGCGLHGIHVDGMDANACLFEDIETAPNVSGCGVYDFGVLGNRWVGLSIAGYGDHGVHKDGGLYQQIDAPAGPGDVPGVSGMWYLITNGSVQSKFPEWDNTRTYTEDDLQLPFLARGDANAGVLDGIYIEGGATRGHAASAFLVMGGSAGFTTLTNHMSGYIGHGGVRNTLGFGADKSFSPAHTGFAKHGGYVHAHIGGVGSTGGAEVTSDMDLLLFENATSGQVIAKFGTGGAAIDFFWFNQQPMMRWHSPSNTIIYDRNSGPSNIVGFRDLLLNEPAGGVGGTVIVGVRYAVPSDSGEYHRGDKYFNGAPSPGGAEGWICTTSGVIPNNGTWTAGTTYGGGSIIVTGAGRFYRNKTFGMATTGNEPVHTSGTVTTGDGLVWAYLGNTTPVFKTFGSIAS